MVPAPDASIVKILIEIRIDRQKLLQVGSGIGAWVMDGKSGSRQTVSPGKSGDDHPMLAAVGIRCAKEDRLALLQSVMDAA